MKTTKMSDPLKVNCPVCEREFVKDVIESHVNKCLFLNIPEQGSSKRDSSHVKQNTSPLQKRVKLENSLSSKQKPKVQGKYEPLSSGSALKTQNVETKPIPLAESMRPVDVNDIVGHKDALGPGTMIRAMLEQRKIPNMILWGPPGCGKTSLANVVSNICKESQHMRFVKLSATMAGINDVKEIVKVAKNEAQFNPWIGRHIFC